VTITGRDPLTISRQVYCNTELRSQFGCPLLALAKSTVVSFKLRDAVNMGWPITADHAHSNPFKNRALAYSLRHKAVLAAIAHLLIR